MAKLELTEAQARRLANGMLGLRTNLSSVTGCPCCMARHHMYPFLLGGLRLAYRRKFIACYCTCANNHKSALAVLHYDDIKLRQADLYFCVSACCLGMPCMGLHARLATSSGVLQVLVMQEELEALQPQLAASQQETAQLLSVVTVEAAEADRSRVAVAADEASAQATAAAVQGMKDECEADLAKVCSPL